MMAVVGGLSLQRLLRQKVLSPGMACACVLAASGCLVGTVDVYFTVLLGVTWVLRIK